MRFAIVLSVIAVACSWAASSFAAAVVDRGHSTPPASFVGKQRAIWHAEWVTCGKPMSDIARKPAVRMRFSILRGWLAVSPQYAARQLAIQVVVNANLRGGYRGVELTAAIDGCRNGMLFYRYHVLS